MIATGAFAQVTPAAGYTPPDDTPKINVGATIFADYTYVESPKAKDADGNTINNSSFNVTPRLHQRHRQPQSPDRLPHHAGRLARDEHRRRR